MFRDLALLCSVGVQPVVVHGGGPEINHWLKRLEIAPQFRDGLRVTDADTMDIVEMVLVGRVNKQIVNGLNRLGAKAVGLSGSDGSLVEARTWGDGSHGMVGDVARINPDVLEPLLERGYVPVISSVAANSRRCGPQHQRRHRGRQVAAALEAEKPTCSPTHRNPPGSGGPSLVVPTVEASDARQLIQDGIVAGGMAQDRVLHQGSCPGRVCSPHRGWPVPRAAAGGSLMQASARWWWDAADR